MIARGTNTTASVSENETDKVISFIDYKDESQLEHVDKLVACDLSEPYSIFTYRYFLHRFPDLCILAVDELSGEVCGCVVGKIDVEKYNNKSSFDNIAADDGDREDDEGSIATITEKIIQPSSILQTGYIGMLAVRKSYRGKGIGKDLVQHVLTRMKRRQCASVTLETEVSNVTAQRLYQNHFGFIREELLVRYYLTGADAYRLRLLFD